MALQKKELNMLAMLAKNEESLSQLYRVYASLFPPLKDFWEDLARDETKHAYWILALQSHVKTGTLSFGEDRFNLKGIESFYRYIKDLVDNAREANKPLKETLAVVFDIENSLLEKGIFEVFYSDSAELKKTLQQLISATALHRDKVNQELIKL